MSEMAEDHKCPECGAEVADVRVTCPNCGREYTEDDYGDKQAGSEFTAGTMVDDDGNEIIEEDAGTAS